MNKKEQQIKNILKNKTIKAYGISIPLTDEQLKKFEKMIGPEYKNPYKRVSKRDLYYTVDADVFGKFKVNSVTELYGYTDEKRLEKDNYFNNEEFAKQIALEMNLQQKLRKFTYENGWSEELWKNKYLEKYFIQLNFEERRFEVTCTWITKRNDIHYISEEIAHRAIDEIIIPFMKENPKFKW